MSLGNDLAAAVASINTDSALLRAIVQGPAGGSSSLVVLPNGAIVKTLARAASEVAGGAMPIVGGAFQGQISFPNGSGIYSFADNGILTIGGGSAWNKGGTIALAGITGGDYVAIKTGANVNKIWVSSAGVGINTNSVHGALEVSGGGGIVVGDGDTIYTGYWGGGWNNAIRAGLKFDGASQSLALYCADAWAGTINSTAWHPGPDNAKTCGTASYRWSGGFTVNAFTVSSGRDGKANIREATAAEGRVAARLRARGVFYQLRDAIQEKGQAAYDALTPEQRAQTTVEDEGCKHARLHFGLIAEDVRDDFAAEGLDGFRYGILNSDAVPVYRDVEVTKWRDKVETYQVEEEKTEIVDGQPIVTKELVTKTRPVGTMKQARNAQGQPLLTKAGEEPTGVIGTDGLPVMRDVLAPRMVFVPERESYTVIEKQQNGTVTKLGLRYEPLAIFLITAGF